MTGHQKLRAEAPHSWCPRPLRFLQETAQPPKSSPGPRAWESPLLTTHTHTHPGSELQPGGRDHTRQSSHPNLSKPLCRRPGQSRSPRGLPAGGAAHRASKQQRGRQGLEGAWDKGGKERAGPVRVGAERPAGGAAAQEAADQVGSSRSSRRGARAEPVHKDPPTLGRAWGVLQRQPRAGSSHAPPAPRRPPLRPAWD